MRSQRYLAPMKCHFGKDLIGAVCGLVLFTGCITIEEEYRFKKDGSGSMTYVVDMSELGEMMATFGEMGEAGAGMSDMGAMNMSGEIAALEGLEGIGKVKLDDKKKWVQRISFNFKDIAALNAALNHLMPDSSGAQHEFFRWEGSTLVRTNNRHAYELGATMSKSDEEEVGESEEGEEEGPDMSMMLESMKYKYSFRFARPIGEVASAQGVNRELSAKEVKLDTDFGVIGRDPNALDLRIDLQ